MSLRQKPYIPIREITRLVDYLWHDEELNFNGELDHIFRSVRRVDAWLRSLPAKNFSTKDAA